jgi:hypothetical protein
MAGGGERGGGDAVDVGGGGRPGIAVRLQQPAGHQAAEQVLGVAATAEVLELAAGGAAEVRAEGDRLELLGGELGAASSCATWRAGAAAWSSGPMRTWAPSSTA